MGIFMFVLSYTPVYIFVFAYRLCLHLYILYVCMALVSIYSYIS